MQNNTEIPIRKCKDCPEVIVKMKNRPRCYICHQEFIKKKTSGFILEKDKDDEQFIIPNNRF